MPGNKGRVCYLHSADKLVFRRKVIPGDRLDLDTRLVSFARGIGKCTGTGSVAGEMACKADFTIVVPEILEEFRPAQA